MTFQAEAPAVAMLLEEGCAANDSVAVALADAGEGACHARSTA